MKAATTVLFAWLLATLCGGCLTIENDGPILSVELFWDDDTVSKDHFLGDDCGGVDVDRMEWVLWHGSNDPCGRVDEENGDCRPADADRDGASSFWLVASDEGKCKSAIDVLDAKPGHYELDITGYDNGGDALWKATCSGLTVLRFDVAYACDIPAP